MRDNVKILAWCFMIYHGIVAILGVVIGAIVFTGGAVSGEREAMFATGVVGAAIACVMVGLSLPGFIAGIGLLRFRPWARILAIIIGALHLLSFPFGTALGIFTFYVLLNSETTAIFEGRTAP
jgi:hypothetical protein